MSRIHSNRYFRGLAISVAVFVSVGWFVEAWQDVTALTAVGFMALWTFSSYQWLVEGSQSETS